MSCNRRRQRLPYWRRRCAASFRNDSMKIFNSITGKLKLSVEIHSVVEMAGKQMSSVLDENRYVESRGEIVTKMKQL